LIEELITAFKDVNIEGQLGQELLKASSKFNAIRSKAVTPTVKAETTEEQTIKDAIYKAEEEYYKIMEVLI
jgi:hypothetical protein